MLVLLSKLVNTDPDARPSAEKVKLGLNGLVSAVLMIRAFGRAEGHVAALSAPI